MEGQVKGESGRAEWRAKGGGYIIRNDKDLNCFLPQAPRSSSAVGVVVVVVVYYQLNYGIFYQLLHKVVEG